MALLLANNVSTTLSVSCAPTDAQLVLASGAGAVFPSPNPATNDYFYATMQTTGGALEIVKVAGRSGDTLTSVTRGVDGTTAQTFAAGTVVEIRIVSQLIRDVNGWQAQLGANNGIAQLNNTGQVPAAQLSATILESVLGTSYYVPQSEVGVASGVASLNSSGYVPATQLGLAAVLAQANTYTAQQNFSAGTLSSTANSRLSSWEATGASANGEMLALNLVRGTAGSTWTTATWQLYRQVDTSLQGIIQFGDTGGSNAWCLGFGYQTASLVCSYDNAWTALGQFTANSLASNTTIASTGNITAGGSLTASGGTLQVGSSGGTFITLSYTGTFSAGITAPSVTDTSDASTKEHVAPMTYTRALDIVMRTTPSTFFNKLTKRNDIGVIADNEIDIVPELIHHNDGLYSVAYQRYVAPLIRVVQEQERRLEVLERLAGAVA